MSKTYLTAYGLDGIPEAGLTPTFITFIRASTGAPSTSIPVISEVGDGLYSYEDDDVPAAFCGIIDFGATAQPRFWFVPSTTDDAILILGQDGLPLPGLTLTWDVVLDADGAPVSPEPTFTDYSNGIYLITGLEPEYVGIIDATVAANPQYLTISADADVPDDDASGADLPTLSLAALRLACQQRADMVGMSTTGFITQQEWNSYINASLYELYDILIATYGNDYFTSSYDITVAGPGDYILPDNLYKLLGVDQIDGNRSITLKPFNFSARNNSTLVSYTISGRYIRIRGDVHATVRIWFIPKLPPMVQETDTFDFISGWQEYVVTDVAIKALQKEQSPIDELLVQKAALKKRIESMAENRDAGSSIPMADVNSPYGWED